jgi:hypothetical protein
MSGFSIDWLGLREIHDMRARNADVLTAATRQLASLKEVRILDLACGSGSSVRALSPHLPARQQWLLADNDPVLLAEAVRRGHGTEVSLEPIRADLAGDLEAVLERSIDLVTMSALLDLVSQGWLDRLSRKAAERGLPVYAALSYDGRIGLEPFDAGDAALIDAVNAHQRTDKGFGPALGPAAARAAAEAFAALDYAIVQGASDWMIGPQDRQMQVELIDGWASAARELETMSPAAIEGWRARRKAAVEEGRSTMRVGHIDFVATPRATR